MPVDTRQAAAAINALGAVNAIVKAALADIAALAVEQNSPDALSVVAVAGPAIDAILVFVDRQACGPLALECGVEHEQIAIVTGE